MALEKFRGKAPGSGDTAIVIGAGRSGVAVSRLLNSKGVSVRLLERNPKAISGALRDEFRSMGIGIFTGEHNAEQFAGANFVVPSPGMPVARVHSILDGLDADMEPGRPEIAAEMEIAWRYLDNEPVLAITGTSGKTTTASLAAAMLNAQGYSVFLGGNIGTPLSEYILSGRTADALVLEISSFQLQACSTFCPRAAVLLNLSPNHLDYHKDMAEYTNAKFRIFRCQDENDFAIIGSELAEISRSFNIASRKVWISPQNRFPATQLLGEHNAFNVEAAWQVCRLFGVSAQNAARAVEIFRPLPHRLENIGTVRGVTYINDSKCTTVSALEVALRSMDTPVRLLCGGKFKGGDLQAIRPLISERVCEVALFGESREHFEAAWKDLVAISWHPALEDAVHMLASHAGSGESILLAPATASFDLYPSYKARGDDFRRIVGELA